MYCLNYLKKVVLIFLTMLLFLYGCAMCGFPVLSKPCCRVPSGEGVMLYCTVLQNGGFEIALLEVFGVSIVLV